jgi:hypothetical protein
VRLQAKRYPHPTDRGVGKASFCSHRANRPARRVERRRAQRPLDHGSNLIVGDCSRPTKASLVKQTVAAVFQRSTTPLANGVFVKAELGSHILRQAVRTSQNDAASLR